MRRTPIAPILMGRFPASAHLDTKEMAPFNALVLTIRTIDTVEHLTNVWIGYFNVVYCIVML